MIAIIGSVVSIALSAVMAWVFWGPVRIFFFSLIPSTAEYAWIGKLLVMVIIAWFGGIGLPLLILIAGLMVSLGVWEKI